MEMLLSGKLLIINLLSQVCYFDSLLNARFDTKRASNLYFKRNVNVDLNLCQCALINTCISNFCNKSKIDGSKKWYSHDNDLYLLPRSG